MTKNLYTFNPFTGVTTGVRLVTGGVNPRNNRPVPPHIACGPAFVAVEKGWQHLPLDRNGCLQVVSLGYIEPQSGAKPFEVLIPPHAAEKNLYCYVDSSVPLGMKLKASPELVRARSAVELTEGARLVIWDKLTQTYLIEFSAENAEVDIWYETGHITRIVRRGTWVVQVPLTATEIAQERVCDFENQVKTLNPSVEADMKRRYGIFAAAVRLLRVTLDRAAEDVYIDFLVEQIPHLTERLREEIRLVLLSKRHPLSGNFLPGWTTNVVQLKAKPVDPEATHRRAEAEKRREALRAARNALTQGMKGPSGGGGQKKRK